MSDLHAFKDKRLKGLDECRPGELFERRREGEKDISRRANWGAASPGRPVQEAPRKPVRAEGDPLTRTTVLIILAAAACTGVVAGLAM
jgi:hypothetical protein